MRKTLLALLLAASVTPAFGQEKTFELKLSHWVPASHPLQKALEDWGAAVERNPGVRSNTRFIPRSSSARRSTITTWRAMGIADVTYVNPGYQPAASRLSAPANFRF